MAAVSRRVCRSRRPMTACAAAASTKGPKPTTSTRLFINGRWCPDVSPPGRHPGWRQRPTKPGAAGRSRATGSGSRRSRAIFRSLQFRQHSSPQDNQDGATPSCDARESGEFTQTLYTNAGSRAPGPRLDEGWLVQLANTTSRPTLDYSLSSLSSDEGERLALPCPRCSDNGSSHWWITVPVSGSVTTS